jgi:hypothetical protein
VKRVFKYPLKVSGGLQSFEIPKFAEVVSVAEQRGELCIWLEVDDLIPLELRKFAVFGTGHKVTGRHCGSVVMEPFVWHVYEVD